MAEPTRANTHSKEDWALLTDNIKRANTGDEAAVAWLQKFLDDNPQVWANLGDLARTAEHAWIALIAGGNSLVSESVRRQLRQLKSEMIGDDPQTIEKMLGDQVIATWLEVKYLETLSADQKGASITQAALVLKKVESAQRRHLNAIRSLVQTRKLLPTGSSLPGLRIYPGERATG
ncbi:MAG: hypothetical protein JWN70_6150 [Planctomycetaceae bacterium]|nr:hypothetical protein [Planctomycetaceae bacterium]